MVILDAAEKAELRDKLNAPDPHSHRSYPANNRRAPHPRRQTAPLAVRARLSRVPPLRRPPQDPLRRLPRLPSLPLKSALRL